MKLESECVCLMHTVCVNQQLSVATVAAQLIGCSSDYLAAHLPAVIMHACRDAPAALPHKDVPRGGRVSEALLLLCTRNRAGALAAEHTHSSSCSCCKHAFI
jgi:hypothetical protein